MKLIPNIALAAVLIASCSKDPTDLQKQDTGVPPKDTGVTGDEDAGVGEDAAVDTDSGVVPDAGVEPVRRLVEFSLFGTSPRDNLVISPDFDLYTNGWFGIALDGMAYAEQTKYHFPVTPTQQPALVFYSPNGAALIGTARSTTGPLALGVWIGYEGGLDESVTAAVSFIGTSTRGTELAYDLAPDESTRMVAGDLVWIRYWGMAIEAPVGFAQYVIIEVDNRRTYVTGPVVSPANAAQLGLRKLPARAVLREAERKGLAEFQRRMRENLGSAKPVLTPLR